MMHAVLRGDCGIVPWRSVLALLLVALYGVNPFDLVPDFIPFVGVVDDAAMLAVLWRALRKDATRFVEWESRQRISMAG